jgi:hypothetical protein
VEAHGVVVDEFHTLGLVVEHCGPGPVIMLEAPPDILGRDRRSVVELGARGLKVQLLASSAKSKL